MDLLILIYFIYSNCKLAKQQGKNALTWGLFTVLAFFVGFIMGMAIIMNFFYNGSLDPNVFPVAFKKFMYDNPTRLLLASALGIGGALFVRFILDRQKKAMQSNENE
jgi:predicted tellurium resistance membrane protein TerC